MDDEVFTVYSNRVLISGSTRDFCLTFYWRAPEPISDATVEQEVKIEERPQARVFVSPQEMKAIAKITKELVDRYEEVHGKLPEMEDVSDGDEESDDTA